MLKNIFVYITFTSFACFIYGIIFIYYWDIEANICHMTYMYRYPQYMKIDVKTNKKFPNYGLYYYNEGKPQEHTKNTIFNGAPIIFIPGNAGSHKQVRSLGSVALRKSQDHAMTKKLDYFSIDFNEELNGLHGGFLEIQKSYLKSCIRTVLKLYKTSNNSKIILIGHSMGGIVAQTMLADKNIKQVINTIVFISTPLNGPVVNFDRKINEFYKKTDLYFNKHHDAQNKEEPEYNGAINDILLISIGGGNRDLLVYEGLTMSKHLDLHAMTSSIPDVWLSCDHLSATWCLELMKVINRFLFSILNTDEIRPAAQRFIDDKQFRRKKAYHFFAGKNFGQDVEVFEYNSTREAHIWQEDNRYSFTEEYTHRRSAVYFKLIPIDSLKTAMFITTNMEDVEDWIYGCIEIKDAHYCAEAVKLTKYVYRIPSNKQQVQLAAYIDFAAQPKSWTHLVIRIPPNNQRLKTLNVDIHEPNERIITVKTKYLFTLTTTTAINATYYRLLLPELTLSYQSLQINIQAQECNKPTLAFGAKISTPWSQGFEKYHQFTKSAAEFVISVPVNAPDGYDTIANPFTLELFLDSGCQFTLSYQTAFGNMMARIVRLYYGNIPAYITAMLLFALALQVTTTTEVYRTLFDLLLTASLRLFFILILAVLVFPPDSFGVPKSILLTLILYGTALVLTALTVTVIHSLLSIQYILANKINLLPQFASLGAIIHMISISLLAISFYFSGGLTIWIGLIYYFVWSVKIYGAQKSVEKYKDINMQVLLCTLYFMLALLNLPATVATLKSWQRNPVTLTDPTSIPALIVTACLLVTWQVNTPTEMRLNKIFGGILITCTCFCIIYCQESVYLLSFVIALVFVLTIIQHIVSKIIK